LAKSSEGYAAKVNLIRRQASAHIRPMLEELQRKAAQLDGQRAQLELDLKATHYVMRNRVAQLHALAAVAAPTGSALPLADF
jgi:hypothetical protein